MPVVFSMRGLLKNRMHAPFTKQAVVATVCSKDVDGTRFLRIYGCLCPAARQGRSYPSGPEATLGCTPDQAKEDVTGVVAKLSSTRSR